MSSFRNTDILIIGSGLSGLSAALMLPDNLKITLITKTTLDECSTSWAQGGIASVLSNDDKFDIHVEDTLTNGHELNNRDVVEKIIKNGPSMINWLVNQKIKFSNKNRKLDLTLEGGHSKRRIVHAKDQTGKIIHDSLDKIVRNKKNITVKENLQVIDVICRGNSENKYCIGAYVYDSEINKVITYSSKKVILATGGAGKIYQYTTNPNTSTGDGIAIAWRAGCTISNMEFIQFHPTCLYHPEVKSFLISESMRGEGAKLLDIHGKPFMHKYDDREELAPRDIVARAIDNEIKANDNDFVYLDISMKSSEYIMNRFPSIYKKCKSIDIDITKSPIPVVPASHYTCGGVNTDIHGRTNIKNLYVIGESAHTGFHGANRLASNSLLECLVMSKYCSIDVNENIDYSMPHYGNIMNWDDTYVTKSKESYKISHNWGDIRKLMWNYVGIVRSHKNLNLALEKINIIEKEVMNYYQQYSISSDFLELRNIVQVSKLITKSALERKESRGLHYCEDFPKTLNKYNRNTELSKDSFNQNLQLVKLRV